jgi:hypothetical protein
MFVEDSGRVHTVLGKGADRIDFGVFIQRRGLCVVAARGSSGRSQVEEGGCGKGLTASDE